MNIINTSSKSKKKIILLFWKDKRENKIKRQIPPIFFKIPGYQKPFILTNISNLRVRIIIEMQ